MIGAKNSNLLIIDVPFFKTNKNPNVFAINIGSNPIVSIIPPLSQFIIGSIASGLTTVVSCERYNAAQ